MRNLSRLTVVLACVAALLLALPAHAAPPQRSHAVTLDQAVASWLGSLWTGLTHLVSPVASRPAGHSGKGLSLRRPGQPAQPQLFGTTNGGSCIDPDGCPY